MCIFRFRNILNPSYIQEVLPLENNFMTVADEYVYVCVHVARRKRFRWCSWRNIPVKQIFM